MSTVGELDRQLVEKPVISAACGESIGYSSSAKSGRTYASNVGRSQLATVAGVSARTDAVRGMFIASATSPK
jgi:hypothetical protein